MHGGRGMTTRSLWGWHSVIRRVGRYGALCALGSLALTSAWALRMYVNTTDALMNRSTSAYLHTDRVLTSGQPPNIQTHEFLQRTEPACPDNGQGGNMQTVLTGYLVSSSSSAWRAHGRSSSLHPIGNPLYPMPTMRLSWFTMLLSPSSTALPLVSN